MYKRIAAVCVALAGTAWAAEIGFGAGGDFGGFYSKYHAKTAIYELQYSGGSPVYYGWGGLADVWFTDNFGFDLGIRYNIYRYNIVGSGPATPNDVVTLNNLTVPFCLKMGYSMGPTRGFTRAWGFLSSTKQVAPTRTPRPITPIPGMLAIPSWQRNSASS